MTKPIRYAIIISCKPTDFHNNLTENRYYLMKIEIYSEGTRQLLFTLFDSKKNRKTNAFRVHKHPELELGYITGGSGDYILENRTYRAESGDLFLVCPNEQHCVPTIDSPELTSFNIYLTSYFLWHIVSEYVDYGRLRMLINSADGLEHRLRGLGTQVCEIMELCENTVRAEASRHRIRFLVLRLVVGITSVIPESGDDSQLLMSAVTHRDDIQKAIGFINDNLTEPITLEEIAKSAGMSRSHFSTTFRDATGIPPYEYLLLQRIERAVGMLRDEDMTIIEVAQSCGFRNLANFNKAFRKITNMTPSDYRASKRKQ